ncbi:MAG: AmmeMemoRadiSam system protein A [SAR324 cluster bacterium]|nr:AmmeMemoRadiSam system protein A [SAR324 cluster bacterium]
MTSTLSDENKNILLRVARGSINNYLRNMPDNNLQADSLELQKKRAVFVTLRNRIFGELRGCIGHTEARYPLIEAVSKTAISSAIDDSRFPQVTLEELPKLSIGINLLSAMTTIKPQDVVVGKHGLQIKKGLSVGLFLPEVAKSQAWDRITFLEQLCIKAGLPQESWQDQNAELFCFESESWVEN